MILTQSIPKKLKKKIIDDWNNCCGKDVVGENFIFKKRYYYPENENLTELHTNHIFWHCMVCPVEHYDSNGLVMLPKGVEIENIKSYNGVCSQYCHDRLFSEWHTDMNAAIEFYKTKYLFFDLSNECNVEKGELVLA
tara:strand:+ start:7976 stop:8386 length:411 start_codon:yes stop_codon:yes gene_type:complete